MNKIKIDEQSAFLFIALLFSLLLYSNGFYLFLPVLTAYILLYHLQQPFKPSVFSLFVIQHFLQIISAIWLCNYLGKDIDYNTSNRSTATIASCVGLFFLAVPIIYFQNKLPLQSRKSFVESAEKFSTSKVMYAYIVSFFLASFLGSIAFLFGGFTQIIISLVKIKWILFLLFGYQCILKGEYKSIFYIFTILEFLSGFLGFFSDFKTVIFSLIVLNLPLVKKLDLKQFFYGTLATIVMGVFALYWTSIKSDYRSFLNGGSNTQNVRTDISSNKSLDKLADLSSNVKKDDLNGSIVEFLDRLQYTYHFAKTIDRVPDVLPFENGNNWLGNLEFTTTPRFLNPNKPTFAATEKTKKYTGIKYLGKEDGVSFSLGYFPEAYIDFGLYGMMGVLFAIGFFYGIVYNYLLKKSSQNLLFNYCVACAFFLEFNALENDGTYLLGRLFSSLVTFVFLVRFVFPALVKYLEKSTESEKDSVAFVKL